MSVVLSLEVVNVLVPWQGHGINPWYRGHHFGRSTCSYCKWLWEGLRVVVNMNVLSNLLSISLTLQKFTVSIEVIYNFNLLTAVQ